MRKIIVGLLLVGLGNLPAAHAGKPPGAGGGGTGGGGTGTEGVVGQNLGVLTGDKYSDAWGVNAQGHAVGRSYNSGSKTTPQLTKAFYWAGSMHRLMPATDGYATEARAISSPSSNSETAVGFESKRVCTPDPTPTDPKHQTCTSYQNPVIWTGDLSASPGPSRLACTTNGVAFGINDAGTKAVGVCEDGVGAIWSSASAWVGPATEIYVPESVKSADADLPFPDGHVPGGDITYQGVALDINDDGIVIGILTTIDQQALDACLATDVRPCAVDVSYSRSYIYSSGTFRVLPTPGGYAETSAYAVSNTTDGKVYVAGWTGSRTGDGLTEISQAIRWTVGATSGDSSAEDVLLEQAWAEGVTQDGLVAGTHNSEPNRRGNIIQTATLWNESVGYMPLKPPGGSDSTSRAMAGRCVGSSGPIYVVGEANVSGAWTAARWEIKCSTASPSP